MRNELTSEVPGLDMQKFVADTAKSAFNAAEQQFRKRVKMLVRRAITFLGPNEAAKLVIGEFRASGYPKTLRRFL
jgi:hypothetical protein